MKRVKKILNSILISLAFLGIMFGGIFFNASLKEQITTSAETISQDGYENTLPEYVDITPSENFANVDKNIFLYQAGNSFDVTIATQEITATEGINWAYIPSSEL